jgi:hypothetical protein
MNYRIRIKRLEEQAAERAAPRKAAYWLGFVRNPKLRMTHEEMASNDPLARLASAIQRSRG